MQNQLTTHKLTNQFPLACIISLDGSGVDTCSSISWGGGVQSVQLQSATQLAKNLAFSFLLSVGHTIGLTTGSFELGIWFFLFGGMTAKNQHLVGECGKS